MLDFNRNRRRASRSGTGRGRLLYLVAGLVFVLILMREARDANHYRWLVAENGARPNEAASSPAPVSPAAQRHQPSALDEVPASLLETIIDGEPFRASEYPAWLRMADVVRRSDPRSLAEAVAARPSYVELSSSPGHYRGKVVELAGLIRRIDAVKAPENDLGLSQYYHGWLQTDDNRGRPLIVHFFTLPKGVSAGNDLSLKVSVTAIFFKRCAYLTRQSMTTAPLVLAKTIRLVAPGAESGNDFVQQPAAEQPGVEQARRKSDPTVLTAQQFLSLAGVDRDDWAALGKTENWDDAENEALLKILYRLGTAATAGDLERWASTAQTHARAASADAPATRQRVGQGEVVRLAGNARRSIVLRPSARDGERYDLPLYYRTEIEVDGGGTVVVFSRAVPRAWKLDTPIDEPASAYAVCLASSDGSESTSNAFASIRVAWHPHTPLGRLGMDVGLLDEVRMPADAGLAASGGAAAQRPLGSMTMTAGDRECFYQMLAAAGRSAAGALWRMASQAAASRPEQVVVRLFNRPGVEQGKLFALRGTARRVLRVAVDDAEIVRRFGIEHYYEIYLFTADSQGNPLVWCVRELPAGMPLGDGAGYAEPVAVSGFFFKTWAYKADRPESEEGGAAWQLAPLLIGRDASWLRTAAQPQPSLLTGGRAIAIAAGGLGLLLVLGYIAQRNGRRRPPWRLAGPATISWPPPAESKPAAGAADGPPLAGEEGASRET